MTPGKTEFRFTGWHMTMIMVAFFGVVVAVNMTLAVLANSSWTGLVVENSYVESQKFNTYLAATRAQDELGWHSALSVERGTVIWRLTDGSGAAVNAARATASFFRPVDEVDDFSVTLTRQSDGSYAAPASPAGGRWIVTLSADAGLDAPYKRTEHIVVGP